VKVLDFGIAKSGEMDDEKDSQGRSPRKLTHPGMTMGTPEYMAPEQAAGRPADPRTDVYAAGGLLYEMLTGKPPYEGSNFMEILHKKANLAPAPISKVRDDVPPVLETLIMRALAKDPAARPQSMDALGRELLDIAGLAFPTRAKIDLSGVEGLTPGPSPRSGSGAAQVETSALLTRLRTWERKKVTVAAGGLVTLVVSFLLVSALGSKRRPAGGPTASLAPATAVKPAVTAPPVAPPVPAAVVPAAPEADGEEPAGGDKDGAARRDAEPPTRTGNGKLSRAAVTAAENKKLLQDGERLLRAERFPEARSIFEQLTKSKRDRGPALVGLAEIAFQEKNYTQAVRSAQLAAERGGGVKARVLQGDAHFRLNHYKEAAKAYEQALKLDPANASAKSGLVLANKRM
jgi:serine/threonine-protein kinase